MNASEAKMRADIDTFGWHIVLVAASMHGTTVAYTVGLFHTFQHPECVVFGLPHGLAHQVLNAIGSEVKNGKRFRDGERTNAILVDYSSAFVEFPKSSYASYLGYARGFYDGDEFCALQFVWPDSAGKFPWDAGVEEHARSAQAVQS